jgi:selenocysteine lyase/cysteine desulfurase
MSFVALTSAISYLSALGFDSITRHEQRLVTILSEQLHKETNFRIISHPNSGSMVSFVHEKIHSHDVATILAKRNIAVRAGHHCAQPCLKALGLKHCLRASIGLYNELSDIEQLISALQTAEELLG